MSKNTSLVEPILATSNMSFVMITLNLKKTRMSWQCLLDNLRLQLFVSGQILLVHQTLDLDRIAYLPTPKSQTRAATILAINDEKKNTAGISVPTIAMLVSVAKRPPAGVKPPYMKD